MQAHLDPMKIRHPRVFLMVLLITVSGGAVFATAGLGGPFRPTEPLADHKIIDMHCHTAGVGAGGSGCFVSEAMKNSYKFDLYLRSFGTSRTELEQHGDAIVIDRLAERLQKSQRVGRAVVLAMDGVVDAQGELDRTRTEIYVPNEFVATEVAKHPNLLFGASVNPYRKDALERLEWAKAHGAVLVKWLPSIQHIDPADPALVPFYDKLVELHLPLLTHTGSEHSFTSAEDALCDPERLRLPLQRGVTIIAAHAATTGTYDGQRSIDRLARLMVEFPTCYADISSLTQINKHGDLGLVLRRPEFRGRLLYGTDYPLVAMSALVSPKYYVDRLTWSQRRAVSRIENIWDRDVALKQALGMPADVWTRAERVLPLANAQVTSGKYQVARVPLHAAASD
jgi:uncharacterized protein